MGLVSAFRDRAGVPALLRSAHGKGPGGARHGRTAVLVRLTRMIRAAGAKERRVVSLLAGGAAVILALLLLGIAGENGYLERRAQRREIQTVSAEIEKIRQENQQLNQKIRDLRSDPRAIEELARERLRLARPGEVIITLPQSQPSATAPHP